MQILGYLFQFEDDFVVEAVFAHDDVALFLPSLYHLLGVALGYSTLPDHIDGGELVAQDAIALLHLQ